MALPRSVKEMSKLDFLPKHCESENFRGFSFIGDSFPLPERSVSSFYMLDHGSSFIADLTINHTLLFRHLNMSTTGIMLKTMVKVCLNVLPLFLMATILARFLHQNQLPRRRSALLVRRRRKSKMFHLLRQLKKATRKKIKPQM